MQPHWVCGHCRLWSYLFLQLDPSSAHQCPSLPLCLYTPFLPVIFPCFHSFSFFMFHCAFLLVSSSHCWAMSRRNQPCRLCPLCSRCAASPTSMEASWLGPSLHCAATRGWLLGSSPTAPENLQTGRPATKKIEINWKQSYKYIFTMSLFKETVQCH